MIPNSALPFSGAPAPVKKAVPSTNGGSLGFALAYERHARHYAKIAQQADQLYLTGGAATQQGLALFDQERSQIDAGWAWAMRYRGAAARLLVLYAIATTHVGGLRYDLRTERIPRL